MAPILRLFIAAGLIAIATAAATSAADIRGDYLEMRTCSVYTGPCFANAEVGLTGHEALMAWSVDEGQYDGVSLDGLHVVLSVRGGRTLGYRENLKPGDRRSVILVDERATDQQRDALVRFAKQHAGDVAGEVVRVDSVPIAMQLDHVTMAASLEAGDQASLRTRKLGQGDCVCTNEIVFYPPLARVQNFEPAFALEASFTGSGLGAKWSDPGTRSAFLATFAE